jgi:hypothetical protein
MLMNLMLALEPARCPGFYQLAGGGESMAGRGCGKVCSAGPFLEMAALKSKGIDRSESFLEFAQSN